MDRGWTGGDQASAFVLRGDPDAIKASGASWSAFGSGAGIAAAAVRAVATVCASEFLGDEGESHAERLRSDVAAGLTIVADAWSRVGRALTVYAGELADCQADLCRLAALASDDRALISSRQAELSARVPDAVPHQVPAGWTSEVPAAQAALTQAQDALAAVLDRAGGIRARHDRAVATCCRAIDEAKDLAPVPPPGLSGVSSSRYVLASVGVESPIVTIRRGLKLAAAGSTGYADQVALALRGSTRFASAPADASDPGGSGRLPPPEKLQKIRDQLFAACMFQYTTALVGDEAGDQWVACTGFADSAISDADRLALALQKYPLAGDPTPKQQSKWQAWCEGMGWFVGAVADVVGVGDCLDGDIGPCIGDIAMTVFPAGRLGKIGKQVVDGAVDAEHAAAAGRAAEHGAEAGAEGAAKAEAKADSSGARSGDGQSDKQRHAEDDETPADSAPSEEGDNSRSSKDTPTPPIPTHITGMTKHGSEQAYRRDGGVGVSDEAMADAVSNPRTPPMVQPNGGIRFEGANAVVVLNPDGLVVTTWATNRQGWRTG